MEVSDIPLSLKHIFLFLVLVLVLDLSLVGDYRRQAEGGREVILSQKPEMPRWILISQKLILKGIL